MFLISAITLQQVKFKMTLLLWEWIVIVTEACRQIKEYYKMFNMIISDKFSWIIMNHYMIYLVTKS